MQTMGLDVDQVQAILDALVRGTRDIEGAGLVTPDGLPLVSVLPGGMDEDQVAAMSAVMLSLGERIGDELKRGSVERIAVDGGYGRCVLSSCNEDAVLLVLASRTAKEGLLLLAIKQAVMALNKIML